MANTRHHPVLNYLRQVLSASAGGGVSDADLLRRFVHQRDEAAFELLLWRHAAMVLHVCRQVLNNTDAAEDAFQATFLVFVRKADSISRREALGSWLYRVAYRIALKARAQVKKRASAASDLEDIEAPPETDDVGQRELRRMICEEVDRLPAKYRAPIVACFFEGKTHEEAAKQLGWPRGTVAGRLARARELLRRRLLRRGVTLTMSALLTALAVRPAQAALTGLVNSVIHTSRLLAAGQAASAVVSPYVAALAEGVLQAMYWTRMKVFVIVLFVVSLGGAGVSLLATQQRPANIPYPTPVQVPDGGRVEIVERVRASDDEDEPPQDPAPEEISPEDAAKLARDMARSRLNLKKLALAMHNYNDTFNHLPPAAITDKKGKALLSWRVALLPYLEQQELYRQFKLDEPWNSPHNFKLLSKMPAVYAPPGIKTRRPYSTFYQVFVSAGLSGRGGMPRMPGGGAAGGFPPPGMSMPGGGGRPGGMAGAPGGMPGGPPGMGGGAPGGAAPEAEHIHAAFIKGVATRFPASIPDGTSNTILIVEAGNPVPWTKPEDLHYASDEALPELGGLFPNVFHAAFADGSIHTLTKNYSEKQMRLAITANDGTPQDLSKIEARSRRRAKVGSNRETLETWQRKNEELRKEMELMRQQIRLLKEEQEVERELAGEDPRVQQLKDEHARMQADLKKMHAELEELKKEIRRPHKPRREEE
ncbi:MAG TPA: sigma-70 family RNA polymerase sigma factor [Gemmataceae bacterium]|nr:sigma-70 family RNA polymerase sigma factor [Gemmataceae bacterium]